MWKDRCLWDRKIISHLNLDPGVPEVTYTRGSRSDTVRKSILCIEFSLKNLNVFN
jgi:hypothetical protein